MLPTDALGWKQPDEPEVEESPGQTVFLPALTRPDAFTQNAAIWAGGPATGQHTVALFRSWFTLERPLAAAELAIFADTRYELWVNGRPIGRGPARFSRQTREYDIHALGDLPAGAHLIAVLVQWAPNLRRSESTIPHLQVHVQGQQGAALVIAERSGLHWRALVSDAWRIDTAPVHAWGLLGPTELLDLRRLPVGWNMPAFDHSAWPTATLVAPPSAHYAPRSIPPLAQVPMPVTVHETGRLSPGRVLIDFPPPVAEPTTVQFNARSSTSVTLEVTTSPPGHPPPIVRLDARELAWEPAGGARPGVYRTAAPVGPGEHSLQLTNVADEGMTIALGGDLDVPAPLSQGNHAGRRVLLAEPVAQPDAVVIDAGDALDLTAQHPPAYVLLDLGRVVHGRLSARAAGPAGTVIDIGWDERLLQGRRALPHPGPLHREWNQVDSWVLDGTERSITTIDARTGRYILIAIWGGPVRLSDIRVHEERYPAALAGSFESSNARLNQIWRVGIDTLYPNMTDAYADPWRERGQWWGDAFVADQVNQVAFGDTRLLRRGVALMGEAFVEGRPVGLAPNGQDNRMLDYGMLWVQSLHDYARQRDDPELVGRLYPTLRAFIDHLASFEHPTSGLLDIPAGHWSQTVYIDTAGALSRPGQSTAVNALYYGTLLDAADIAERAGDTARASAWRQRAAQLRAQVHNTLYLPREGRYVTSIVQGSVRPPGPHAQAWALAYGLPPASEVQRVADALLELLSSDTAAPNLEIYGMFWALEGLGRAGRVSDGLMLIERWYGHMLDKGATTWWERFNAHLSYAASLSHGWGGAPTWFLTTYVAGARQAGPHSWIVAPPAQGPARVRSSLPLPDGDLKVDVQRTDCSTQIWLDAPATTSGAVLIPHDDQELVLTVNGMLAWDGGRARMAGVRTAGDAVRITLAGGSYTVRASGMCSTRRE